MKRIITLILAAAMLSGFSAAAFADVIPPSYIYVSASVTNPDGTTFYYYVDGVTQTAHIPYNSSLKVRKSFSGDIDASDYLDGGIKVSPVIWEGRQGYVPYDDIAEKPEEPTEATTEKTTEATTAEPKTETTERTTARTTAKAEVTTAEETTSEETTQEETTAVTVTETEAETAADTEYAAQETSVKSAAEEKASRESGMIKICAAAAVIVALTAGVTIALFKKKKG